MDAAPSIAGAADAARPELRAIALFEAGKGVLSLVAASALAVAGPAPLQQSVLMLLARLRGGQVPVPPAWLKVALNPDSVRLAEMAMEVCDGAPMRTAASVNEFFELTGRATAQSTTYCPWSAYPVDVSAPPDRRWDRTFAFYQRNGF